jgi:hypothetical protein
MDTAVFSSGWFLPEMGPSGPEKTGTKRLQALSHCVVLPFQKHHRALTMLPHRAPCSVIMVVHPADDVGFQSVRLMASHLIQRP